MKKFYFILIATLTVALTSAAISFSGVKVAKPAKNAVKLERTVKAMADAKAPKTGVAMTAIDLKRDGAPATRAKKAPRKASEIINTAPEGEKKYYARSGTAFRVSSGNYSEVDQDGIVEVVFAENDKVYLKDPVNNHAFGTYIEGDVIEGELHFAVGQTLYTWTDYGYGAELQWINLTRGDSGITAAEIDEDSAEVVFLEDPETGVLTLQNSDENHVLGTIWDDDLQWTYRGDYNTVLTPTELPETVTPPEGLESQFYYYTGKYTMFSENYKLGEESVVEIKKDGNEYYIKGLAAVDDDGDALFADVWVKGTLDGNTLTIPMLQYVGTYSSYSIYLTSADDDGVLTDITFTYDAEADSFTLDADYYVNAASDRVYYLAYFHAGNLISKELPELPGLVTPPEGIAPETYYHSGKYTFNNNVRINTTVSIVKDGSDYYVQGLAAIEEYGDELFTDVWVKGTFDGETLTIPMLQYVGVYSSYSTDYDIYFTGANEDGNLADVVFYYDAENDVFTLADDYYLNAATDRIYYLAYFHAGNVLSKEEPAPLEAVTPPEGLTTTDYQFTAKELTYEEDEETGEYNEVYTDYSEFVKIGFDGNDLYIQGICQELPEAWVKGTVEGNIAIIPACQYIGTYVDDTWSAWGIIESNEHFITSLGDEGFDAIVLDIEQNGKRLVARNYIIDNEDNIELNPWHIYDEGVFGEFNEKEAKPADPEITSVTVYSSYTRVALDIPTVDINGEAMNTNKLFYRIFTDVEKDIQPFVFTTDLYDLEDDLVEVPYNLDDDYDFYKGGNPVYLNGDCSAFNRIGVQTVYYGGMDVPANPAQRTVFDVANNESAIVWYKIKDYIEAGIIDVNSKAKELTGVRYYNVNGQSSDKPFSGINIIVRSYSDGSTVTTKGIKR